MASMLLGFLPFGADNRFADKLRNAGCQKLVILPENNRKSALSGFLGSVNEGDVIVFCQLDHLGTIKDLFELTVGLGKKRAHTKILLEDIDTLRDTALYLSSKEQ
nr:hypothetical protein [uncultured Dyadobacter sp.]